VGGAPNGANQTNERGESLSQFEREALIDAIASCLDVGLNSGSAISSCTASSRGFSQFERSLRHCVLGSNQLHHSNEPRFSGQGEGGVRGSRLGSRRSALAMLAIDLRPGFAGIWSASSAQRTLRLCRLDYVGPFSLNPAEDRRLPSRYSSYRRGPGSRTQRRQMCLQSEGDLPRRQLSSEYCNPVGLALSTHFHAFCDGEPPVKGHACPC
jgi:hypothetical protein